MSFVHAVGRGASLRYIIAACVGLSLAAAANPQEKAKRPNIVVILADDMGYSDIGCYGGEIRTPNLNKLAAGGLRFKNFTNTGRCCPTRASLLTGLYSHQAGVGAMVNPGSTPAYAGQLNTRCVTIAELLRGAGYRCHMIGKWHVTSKDGYDAPNGSWPTQRGFDTFFGTLDGAGSFYRPTNLCRDLKRLPMPEKDFYYTDAISQEAVDVIRDHKKNHEKSPFFIYLAHKAPHWPLHAPSEDVARYRDVYKKGWDVLRSERIERMRNLGIIGKDEPPSPRDSAIPAWDSVLEKDREALAHKMAVYAAQIDRMDQGIGRVVGALKETGAFDDTLILFLSDNGGCHEGGLFGFERQPGGVVGEDSSFASYGQCWAWLSNAIFRLYKHWVHGGGVNTPLVAHWPRGISEQNAIRSQRGHVIDILATCIDLAGARYPADVNGKEITPLEGKSLVPAFANRPIERDAIYWEHLGNRAVLAGKWKLVAVAHGPWELYDIDADRNELKNLAATHPDQTQRLAAQWQAWADRVGVVLPRPAGKKN